MMRTALLVLAALLGASPGDLAADTYDLVLEGGRVIDPETGLDGVRNVGIRGGTIAAVSTAPLAGKRSIDANGLVVAPGFIDLHQHAQSAEGYRLMALDGVTTGLELEIGVPDLAKFVETRRGRTPVHYGASSSYLAARVRAWDAELQQPSHLGPDAGILPQSGPATNEASGPERLARVLARLKGELEAGSLGIGVGLEYAPGTTRHELIEVFRVAAVSGSPVFVHARSSGLLEPGSGIESVTELAGVAAITGAPLHIVHINSTCMRDAPECIAMIAGARERGLDITTEAYPYTVAMTAINSALFNPGWREKRGLDYDDLEIPATGERLTRERFEELHVSPDWHPILIHTNPDEVVDAIMAAPLAMIASDGSLMHPRGAGSYSRVLSRYVRDRQSLTLPEAIRKMSLMPAQRLEALTPEAKRLGRLQVGARADLVVFDAGSVTDRATFRAPTEPSEGVRYLVVDGTVVVDEGRFIDSVFPGQPLLRSKP